jgi:glycerol-3-phosphate dehydrogenase
VTLLPGPEASYLTPARRERSLEALAHDRYDVVVVGGGVTGAGVALDAVSRGLRTALVERADLATGTSRWSSKLVHGGVRYLASGQVGVAWESARERHALITTIAPHLVQPVAFLVPLDDATGPVMGRVCGAGARAADLMRRAARTPTHLLPAPTRISAQDALVHAPCLDPARLRGGLLSWDGRLEDDARLVVALARTAAALGADVVTGVAAHELAADRVLLTDTVSGTSVEARGTVVNATGVWAGEHEPSLRMVPSRGSHLVLRAASLGWPRAVLTVPVPGHLGRFVFAVPQPDGLVLLGLTDEPAGGDDPAAPAVPEQDEAFLLATVGRALAVPLGPRDVVGRFAGLRPLVHGDGATTADLSRRHLLLDEPGRPLTITGGKLTTYRRMAQDTVDAVCRRLGRTAPSRTRTLPLVGAASRAALARVPAPAHLVRRYGTEALAVHELGQRHPRWAAPVAPGCATTGAELLFGALAEGARTVEDLLDRRTRVSLVDGDRDAAVPVARAALEAAAATGGTRRTGPSSAPSGGGRDAVRAAS